MPTYQFRCPDCATLFEERRSFAEADKPSRCPDCAGERAAKVIGTAMFFAPGTAARAILDPSAKVKAASRAVAAHTSDCPCCRGGVS